MTKNKVTTAVIAAGGYGTRYMPFTKVVPKELLPLGDTPTIELLVRECMDSGIKKIYIIVRSDSDLIQSHFSKNALYEKYLLDSDKGEAIAKVSAAQFESVELIFVKEDETIPYGNARGLFTIREELEREDAFLLLFGDDIVLRGESSVKGILAKYEESDCEAVVGVQRVPFSEVPRYGNVKIKAGTTDQVETMIQKPRPEQVVSDLVIYSQLILTPAIFNYFSSIMGHEELDAGVALHKLAQDRTVLTYVASGTWVTIGDPLNHLKANLLQMISLGLTDKRSIIEYIESL